MTVHTDLAAITPTSTARTAFEAAGSNLDALLAQLDVQVADLKRLLNQIISTHPNTGGDTTNHAALVSLLAELA